MQYLIASLNYTGIQAWLQILRSLLHVVSLAARNGGGDQVPRRYCCCWCGRYCLTFLGVYVSQLGGWNVFKPVIQISHCLSFLSAPLFVWLADKTCGRYEILKCGSLIAFSSSVLLGRA